MIICIKGNILKIFISPTHKNITNDVKPSVTPRISGIVLAIPKLNQE